MKSLTEIVVILDRSGSMCSRQDDHEGGLNAFVKEQKQAEGLAHFTFVKVDGNNPFDVVYDGVPIKEVGECMLDPRGSTPILDGIGKTINHVSQRLKTRIRQPDQVVCMVITDGLENASKEFTKPMIAQLIKDKEKENWNFLYLGAGIDALAEARQYGFGEENTSSVANNSEGVRSAYSLTSSKLGTSRSMYNTGASKEEVENAGCVSFSDEDKDTLTQG